MCICSVCIWSHLFSSQLMISHVLIGRTPENQQRNKGHRTFLSFRPYIGMAALVTCVEFFIAMVLCCSTVTTIWLTDWGNVSFHYANFLFFADIFLLFWEMICYHFCTFVLSTIEPLMMKFEFFNFQQLLLLIKITIF